MNLHKLILVNNACYKAGKTIAVKGICVHSTGANNPNLCRYVAPDDGLLGKNAHNNHWNQDSPGGRHVCVHAFIGKLADGSIATYQTLPWNYQGWHCGSGPNGSGNSGLIGFEICEDNLTDAVYFRKVFNEAVELCAYLCREYGIQPEYPLLICHSEAHKLGIASSHSDVMHWFPKHGESMDTFRAAVKRCMEGQDVVPPLAPAPEPAIPPAPAPEPAVPPATNGYYRVRLAWADAKTQKGAYKVLSNAKRCADKNPGYSVFDSEGAVVYTAEGTPAPLPDFPPYTIRVIANVLNIRKQPDSDAAVVGTITGKGVYTIVDEVTGSDKTVWGKLKSGAGWINLDYTQER